MRARIVLQLALLTAMLVWAVSAQAASLTQTLDDFGVQRPRIIKPAPDFTLPTPHGGKHSLSDARGKVVLLTFWASWCGPCRHEMPQIESLWQRYRQNGLIVLAVNVDRGNRDHVLDFVRKRNMDFPIVLDSEGEIRNRYEVRALPTSYLIGHDGNIIGRIIGERDWSSPAALSMIRLLVSYK